MYKERNKGIDDLLIIGIIFIFFALFFLNIL
jgi:hypothetical protein